MHELWTRILFHGWGILDKGLVQCTKPLNLKRKGSGNFACKLFAWNSTTAWHVTVHRKSSTVIDAHTPSLSDDITDIVLKFQNFTVDRMRSEVCQNKLLYAWSTDPLCLVIVGVVCKTTSVASSHPKRFWIYSSILISFFYTLTNDQIPPSSSASTFLFLSTALSSSGLLSRWCIRSSRALLVQLEASSSYSSKLSREQKVPFKGVASSNSSRTPAILSWNTLS